MYIILVYEELAAQNAAQSVSDGQTDGQTDRQTDKPKTISLVRGIKSLCQEKCIVATCRHMHTLYTSLISTPLFC